MTKLAVLVSDTGTGTNLQAITDAIEAKKLHVKIAAVVSDTEHAGGVARAKKQHLPVEIVTKTTNLIPLMQKYRVNYICLAGWKQIIPDTFIDAFPNRILNLHPGLIPDTVTGVVKNPDSTIGLWNKGKLTNVAIKNFLDQKSTYAGSSVHFLTHEFDFGPVLGRTFEKIEPNDTVETLYQRLKQKENQLYVDVLTQLCN